MDLTSILPTLYQDPGITGNTPGTGTAGNDPTAYLNSQLSKYHLPLVKSVPGASSYAPVIPGTIVPEGSILTIPAQVPPEGSQGANATNGPPTTLLNGKWGEWIIVVILVIILLIGIGAMVIPDKTQVNDIIETVKKAGVTAAEVG